VKPRYKNLVHKLFNKNKARKVHEMFQNMYSSAQGNLKPALMKDIENGKLEI